MFTHRPNSNQARICVLGFSSNSVWLVSRFYIFTIYYKVLKFSIPMTNTIGLCELSWPNGLKCRSLNSEVRKTRVRSQTRVCFFVLFFIFSFFSFHFSFSLVFIVFQFMIFFIWFSFISFLITVCFSLRARIPVD